MLTVDLSFYLHVFKECQNNFTYDVCRNLFNEPDKIWNTWIVSGSNFPKFIQALSVPDVRLLSNWIENVLNRKDFTQDDWYSIKEGNQLAIPGIRKRNSVPNFSVKSGTDTSKQDELRKVVKEMLKEGGLISERKHRPTPAHNPTIPYDQRTSVPTSGFRVKTCEDI